MPYTQDALPSASEGLGAQASTHSWQLVIFFGSLVLPQTWPQESHSAGHFQDMGPFAAWKTAHTQNQLCRILEGFLISPQLMCLELLATSLLTSAVFRPKLPVLHTAKATPMSWKCVLCLVNGLPDFEESHLV